MITDNEIQLDKIKKAIIKQVTDILLVNEYNILRQFAAEVMTRYVKAVHVEYKAGQITFNQLLKGLDTVNNAPTALPPVDQYMLFLPQSYYKTDYVADTDPEYWKALSMYTDYLNWFTQAKEYVTASVAQKINAYSTVSGLPDEDPVINDVLKGAIKLIPYFSKYHVDADVLAALEEWLAV